MLEKYNYITIFHIKRYINGKKNIFNKKTMSFNIKISNGKGNVQNIKVSNSDTIGQVKSAAHYTPIESWKFKTNGEILSNDKTIEYYGIEPDDCIVASKNQIGGEPYE